LEGYEKEFQIYGIVGVLDLDFGKYLVYVKRRRYVCAIGDVPVYRITEGGAIRLLSR
jgi:hypothetical protein